MSDHPSIWEYDCVIPSEVGAEQCIQQEVMTQLERQEWGSHDVFGVHLSLEEALVNAIKHGNRFDPAKSVRVECRLWPDLLRVTISDEGEGFDPNAVPDPTDAEHIDAPCGRGLLLMRNFMSKVCYNERGNTVMLEKTRSAADSPPVDG